MDNIDCQPEASQETCQSDYQAFGEDFLYVALTAIVVCTYAFVNVAAFLV
jgi:hypothetical protein